MFGKEFERIRLMIAMDHDQMREGFKQIVKRAGGVYVAAVSNHKDAVEEMNNRSFNMFMVEDRFPTQGGLDFCRFLRLISGPMSYAPVILGLHEPDKQTIMAARDAGVNAITALPMTPQVFTKTVTTIRDQLPGFVAGTGYFGPDRRKKPVPVPVERRVTPAKLIPGPKLAAKLFPEPE